jgi:hypothetical protein
MNARQVLAGPWLLVRAVLKNQFPNELGELTAISANELTEVGVHEAEKVFVKSSSRLPALDNIRWWIAFAVGVTIEAMAIANQSFTFHGSFRNYVTDIASAIGLSKAGMRGDYEYPLLRDFPGLVLLVMIPLGLPVAKLMADMQRKLFRRLATGGLLFRYANRPQCACEPHNSKTCVHTLSPAS